MKFIHIFIIATFAAFFSAQSEYLLFKKDIAGNRVIPTIEEYKKAFPILEKYQFPRSLAHKEELIKELNQDQLIELAEHEQQFIQSKLDVLHENFELIYIPTTLWELLVLRQLEQEIIKRPHLWFPRFPRQEKYVEQLKKYNPTRFEDLDLLIMARMTWNSSRSFTPSFFDPSFFTTHTSEASFNDCENPFSFESTAPEILGFLTNKAAIQGIAKDSPSYDSILSNYKIIVDRILQDIRATFKIITKLSISPVEFDGMYIFSQIARNDCLSFFDEVIDHEIMTNVQGYYLIYRGTDGHNGNLDEIVKDTGFQGLSYANSLFAGALMDSVGDYPGCAFIYCVRPDLVMYCVRPEFGKYFYALSVPKKDMFIKNPNFDTNFYFKIPPVTTASGLCANGEVYHARTIAISGREPWAPLHEQYFQQFLRTHATILPKEKITESGDDFGFNLLCSAH